MSSQNQLAQYYFVEQLKHQLHQQYQQQHFMDLMGEALSLESSSQQHGLSQPISSQTIYSQPLSQCMEIKRRVEEFDVSNVLAKRDENSQFDQHLANLENDIRAQQFPIIHPDECSIDLCDRSIYNSPNYNLEIHTFDSRELSCELEDPIQMIILPENGSHAVGLNIIARDRDGNRCKIISNQGCEPNHVCKMDHIRQEKGLKVMPVEKIERNWSKEEENRRKVQEEVMIENKPEETHVKRKPKIKFSRASAPRFRKTPQQLAFLEQAYERVKFPPVELLEELSDKTMLSGQQIRLWFQHKRNKSRDNIG